LMFLVQLVSPKTPKPHERLVLNSGIIDILKILKELQKMDKFSKISKNG